MAQEYEQPVDGTTSPRTQRMTAAESRAVIDLWQQERTEQTGLTDRPAVPDVAEGLDITVEDVQRLLSEIRARRLEEERALAAEQVLMVAERRLAEEEAGLAELRRQRAELRREQKQKHLAPSSRWVEVKPGVWEDAGLPGYSYLDFNQLAPNQQATPRSRRGKPRQPAPVEWTGAEDFWQRTEEDSEFGKQHRAARIRKNSRYALGAAMLLPVFLSLVLVILSALGMKP